MRIGVERNTWLERIDFDGRVHIPGIFADGSALFEAMCEAGAGGSRGEAAARALPSGRAQMGQDEESPLLALRAGARKRPSVQSCPPVDLGIFLPYVAPGRWVAWTCALVLALQFGAVGGSTVQAAGAALQRVSPERINAEALKREIERGRVARRGTTIVGDVMLSGVVSQPFSCIGCDFRGSLRATNVSFRQRINLSGSDFEGPADFSGSTFGGDAVFADTLWLDPVRFDDAAFAAETNFRRARFGSVARFERAEFRGRADFGVSEWRRGAAFAAARFSDASFARASFRTGTRQFEPALDIHEVDASRRLDFGEAGFDGEIAVGGLTTPVLVLAPHEAAKHIRESDAVNLLRRIESSAKRAENFALANDAFYERQILLSHQYSTPRRVMDIVFYRTIAGYLVRPFRPLFTLLVLLAVLSIIRALRRSREAAGARRLERAAAFSSDFGERFKGGLVAAVRWRSSIPAGMGGVEVVTYRVLIVCALVGLYADPSTRQIFEFLRG